MPHSLFQFLPEQKLLCLALSAEISIVKESKVRALWQELQGLNRTQRCVKMAICDEVGSHLAVLLQRCGLEVPPELIQEKQNVEGKTGDLMDALEEIAVALDQKNIPIIALKNAGIAKGIFTELACSPMGDIDLLVEPENFKAAHAVIESLGYHFKFRSKFEQAELDEALAHGSTEYFKDSPRGRIWVELQWRPIAGRWIQPQNEPKAQDLFTRSIPIPNSKVRLLCPEDNLIQVALHTAKHSYLRAPGFRLHSDVDRIVRCTEIHWDTVVDRVQKLEVKTAVYFSLFFAKNLLETPVPDSVLQALLPSKAKQKIILNLIQKAGLFDQTQPKFTKWSYIVFVLMLYDHSGLILEGIFPPPRKMLATNNSKRPILLPYFYVKRWWGLMVHREGI